MRRSRTVKWFCTAVPGTDVLNNSLEPQLLVENDSPVKLHSSSKQQAARRLTVLLSLSFVIRSSTPRGAPQAMISLPTQCLRNCNLLLERLLGIAERGWRWAAHHWLRRNCTLVDP